MKPQTIVESAACIAPWGKSSALLLAALLLGCSGKEATAPAPNPVKLAFTVQPNRVNAGVIISPPIRVAALDPSGNVAKQFTGIVTVQITASSSGAVLTGTTTLHAIEGVATFSDLKVTKSGDNFTFLAASRGMISASSALFGIGQCKSACWTDKASIPDEPPINFRTGAVNDVVYVVGGYGESSMTAVAVRAYDAVTDSWTYKAPLTAPRASPAVAVLDGKLYAIGGYGGYDGERVVATVEAYDPATDRWTTKSSLSAARADLCAGVVNGILYAAGGMDSSNTPVGIVEAYDPAMDKWTKKATMTPRRGCAAGVVDGIFYVLGGDNADFAFGPIGFRIVEAYDPAIDAWAPKPAMPVARTSFGVGVINGVLYALGGWGGNDFFASSEPLQTVDSFDPRTNRWKAEPSMASARAGVGVGVIGGALYALGGISAQHQVLATVEAFVP